MDSRPTLFEVRDQNASVVADQPLSPDSDISWLQLSAKERHALDVLGVKTVREFLELDLCRVLGLRGYGTGTYSRLRRSRERIRHLLYSRSDTDTSECAFLQTSAEDLGLSKRAMTALCQLRVETVWDFLSLDIGELGHLRNCGITTREELARRQQEVRSQLPPEFEPSMQLGSPASEVTALQDAMQSPATTHSWTLLPLFSGKPANGIDPSNMHESYRSNVAVEHLGLPARACRVLAERGVISLGQLLLTSARDLLGSRHLGRSTLARMRAVVEEFLEHSLGGTSSVEIDARAPSKMRLGASVGAIDGAANVRFNASVDETDPR